MGEKKNQQNTGQHVALYRKYRSKSLDEIKGQEHITKTIGQAIKSGKISHAYLFTGPRGTGKTSVARIVAHEINNLPYQDEKTHLDIIEIDAASNRRIDDVRELRDKVHIAPVSAKYKVYIIDEVHMLTTESFNALLKTLEEPPAHVVFILATTEVHKLPATIISRTQRHTFRFIPQDQIIEHLECIAKQENIDIDSGALRLLAHHGGGSFRDSISLLDQLAGGDTKIDTELVELLLGLAPQDKLDELLSSTLAGDSSTILKLIDELLASGLTPSGLAAQLLDGIRLNITNNGADEQLIKAMSSLLSIHNAYYPRLTLEASLLEVNHQESNRTSKSSAQAAPSSIKEASSATTSQAASVQSKVKRESKESEPPASINEEKVTTEAVDKGSAKKSADKQGESNPPQSISDISKEWGNILKLIKQKHSPIYTVLRLATPEFNDSGIMLYFQFPFHQKKVDEPKHKAIIAEAILETINQNVNISTAVDKSKVAKKPQSTEENSAHASLIANVQDIMGGGEVVEV